MGMTKKCPECGSDLQVGAGSCSKCGLLVVSPESAFGDLSKEQEKRLIEGVSARLAGNKRFMLKAGLSAFLWLFAALGLFFGWGIWSAKVKLDSLVQTRFD